MIVKDIITPEEKALLDLLVKLFINQITRQ